MYLPPVLRPVAAAGPVTPTVQRLAEAPFSLVRGLPGSYAAERLAGVIDGWQRLPDCVWLRANDARPAELERSLGAACQHRWSPERSEPEPTGLSYVPVSKQIEAAPEGAVIVLELGGRVTPGLTRLIRQIRPVMTDRRVRLVVVAESRFHLPVLHGPDRVVPATDLLDCASLERSLSDRNRTRLLRYAGRRPAVLGDVLAAAHLWSQDSVTEALETSHSLSSLLGRLTSVLLDQLTPDQRSALEVALSIGYWHPQMGARPVAPEQLRPWLVPMEQQWGWVRPIWVPALRWELSRATVSRTVLDAAVSRPVAELEPARPSESPAETQPESSAMRARSVARAATHSGLLEARLLGSLAVRIDGSPVPSWNGQRGASVLRYLLFKRRHACARDELLEEFWPDIPLGTARNRLQVAVSGLRKAFLDVTALNVVEFADGGYRINPDLLVEVDIENFERGLRAADAAERAGNGQEARTAYQQAIALYRGDFASDAPFEQWTLLPRESARVKLVDALDRLSRLELAEDRMEDCIATAHRMLDIDPCREDAHRLLMRCFAAQGRTYQALRQYEFCGLILRATIDASPAAETTALYRAIRTSSGLEPAKNL